MAKIIRLLILILILTGVYYYRVDIGSYLSPKLDYALKKNNIKLESFGLEPKIKTRCDSPIKYSIGSIGAGFNIDQAYVAKALKDAEKVWEDESGKNLFDYDQNKGDLKVNLIYDYRQQTKNDLSKIGIVVTNDRTSYEQVKTEYDTAKANYLKYKTNYDATVLAFNSRTKAYQTQVVYWNNRGGAPQKEYDELTLEKNYLDSKAIEIQNMYKTLITYVNKVNGLANILNSLVETLNLHVKEYNTIGAKLGESYEEGLYTEENGTRKIDIFEIDSYEQLVRVLAHELGHSLGIGHVADPEAVMYERNNSKGAVLTNDDKVALGNACGLQIER